MVTTNRSIAYTQNKRFVRQRKKKKSCSIFRVLLIVVVACCVIIKTRFGKLHKSAPQHRIAIIIPYLSSNGPYLPPYMGIFLQSAAGSKDLVDFLIFHNGQLRPSLDDSTIDGIFIPSNVKFINLGSMDSMSNLLLRVVDQRLSKGKENRIKLVRIISKLLEGMPYALIEFKPAYGHIFDDYIPKDIYSHWGYSDFDVMFGDLPHWITPDELEGYDIVTYSFGDQYRVYIRGQFTFHRNNDKINNIWRSCDYLTNMDRRLLKMFKEKRFSIESAEGCYSYAVLQRKDIKVKYASKALTDANNKEIYKNGIIITTGRSGQRRIILTHRSHAHSVFPMPVRWFEDDQYEQTSPQWEIDTMRVIEPINTNEGCMHWVPSKYRHALCFQSIESTDNVFLIDGILFKQPFRELMGPEQARTTKALFHFQDGKRIFGSSHLLAFLGESRKHGWVLDRDGAYQLQSQKLQIYTRNLRYRLDRGLGHNRYRSHMLPDDRICLKTSNIKDHMSSRCDYSLSWLDADVYKLMSDDWLSVDVNDVTLVLTAQINTVFDFGQLLNAVAHNFIHWKDSPVILLIHLKGPPKRKSELIDTIRSLSIQRSSYLIGIVGYRSDMNVNSKSLLSLAEVPCKTRWIVSGIDSTEGLVLLSKESSYFARRVSNLYKGSSGHAFIIPKMIMNKIDMSDSDLDVYDISSYSLFAEKYHLFQAVIKGCCGPLSKYEQSISRQVDYIWRVLNQKYIEESMPQIENEGAREDQLARYLTRLQKDILCLFNRTNVESLLQFHSSPIIMVDKQGPFNNMETFRMIKDSFRLPDKCTNGVRIAKLALIGYNIMPLPGAFAVSRADATSCAQKDCSICEINDEQRKMISIEKSFAAKTFLYSRTEER